MADYTALHARTGSPAGASLEKMIIQAVEDQLAEAQDLEWKRQLPGPVAGLKKTDLPKDIAAMANGGGGVIVYGVTEEDGQAVERYDVGNFSESDRRTIERVAVEALNPPLFGVHAELVGDETRALIVVVPASVDAPHLISSRPEHHAAFLVPRRDGAKIEWLKEAQLAAAYRTRAETAAESRRALDDLYSDVQLGDVASSTGAAQMYAVARPHRPFQALSRPGWEETTGLFETAWFFSGRWLADPGTNTPLTKVRHTQPRPGLRRWVYRAPIGTAASEDTSSTWAATHDDGSVSIGAAIGRAPVSGGALHAVLDADLETLVLDLFAMVQASRERHPAVGDFDVRIGIEWDAASMGPLVYLRPTFEGSSSLVETDVPIRGFVPIRATIRTDVESAVLEQLNAVVVDVLNQGGLGADGPRLIRPA